MNLEYIEELINRENIQLINAYLKNSQGLYANYNNIKFIIYDKTKIRNSYEKKQILIEELSHYYYNATYNFNSDLQFINKQEYKAKMESYNLLIPFDKLQLLMQDNSITFYDLADYFEVTVEYMQNAIEFYINKYGNFIKNIS